MPLDSCGFSRQPPHRACPLAVGGENLTKGTLPEMNAGSVAKPEGEYVIAEPIRTKPGLEVPVGASRLSGVVGLKGAHIEGQCLFFTPVRLRDQDRVRPRSAMRLQYPAKCLECKRLMRAGMEVGWVEENGKYSYFHTDTCPDGQTRQSRRGMNMGQSREPGERFYFRDCPTCGQTWAAEHGVVVNSWKCCERKIA